MGSDERSERRQELASKTVFTTGEAAQVCKVSQQTIIRCFDKGQLTGFRVPGSRFRRIPREDLMRFMEKNGIPLDPILGDGSEHRRVLVFSVDPRLGADSVAAATGFEVKRARTAYEAGMVTEQFKPQLIVLDGANGGVPSACRAIRESDSVGDATVVVLTTSSSREEATALLDDGASEVIVWDGAVESLAARLREHGRVGV